MIMQNFIWDSYYKNVDGNSPQSLSLFENKIKSLCSSVKDKILSKYLLNKFMKKIYDLTPNINFSRNNFKNLKKENTCPLRQTKDLYNKRNKFEERQLKEFSILFLVINNLDLFRKNIELISEVNFAEDSTNKLKQQIINYLLSEKYFDRKKIIPEDLEEKRIVEL